MDIKIHTIYRLALRRDVFLPLKDEAFLWIHWPFAQFLSKYLIEGG